MRTSLGEHRMRTDFVKQLLLWYNASRRDLPWRHTRDPYRIWISEIMLQQTRVQTVIGYYRRFLAALPEIADLALCGDDRLLKLWEGLGYYSRARNLKRAAQVILSEHGGSFPETEEGIRHLPGIGAYTAGAVGSIAFDLPLPAVDGNVLRVWARVHHLEEDVLRASVRTGVEREIRALHGELEAMRADVPEVVQSLHGDFNQALIELGATVCTPSGEPGCGRCPLREMCAARADGSWAHLPVRKKQAARRIEERTVLLIRDGDQVCVSRRPERGLLAGLYEFPCIEGRHTAKEAAAYVESRGCTALQVQSAGEARHIFSHLEWHMTGYEIRIASDREADAAPEWIFAAPGRLSSEFPIAAAYAAYAGKIGIDPGKKGEL